MTSNTLTLRRAPLAHALHTLSPTSLRTLLHLALMACPATGRVWTTPLRIAEDLHTTAAAAEELLALLAERKLLSLWSRSHGALRCYELGDVLARSGEAPANLPVEQSP